MHCGYISPDLLTVSVTFIPFLWPFVLSLHGVLITDPESGCQAHGPGTTEADNMGCTMAVSQEWIFFCLLSS